MENRYDKYKDSGIAWIGEIPEHWNLALVKSIFNRRTKKNNPILTEERLSLSIEKGVTLYSEKTTNLDRFKEDFTQYQIAYPNDIVLNSMNMIVGAIGISHYLGCVSPVYYVITPKDKNINVNYYGYLLNNFRIRNLYHALGEGIYAIDRGEGRINTCRLKVSYNKFGSIIVPIPSINEQQSIATYLDQKCSEIDELIILQEEMITKLQSYKQSVITEAVTKGLDKNVPLKDSGIEWIGEIPEHWEVKRLKNVCSTNNASLSDKTSKDFEFDYVDIGSVSFELGIHKTEKYTFQNAPSRARKIARLGDIIVSTVRTYLRAIDIINSEEKEKYIYSTGFAILSPSKNILSEFMIYICRSEYFTNQVSIHSTGINYPSINDTALKMINIVMPPLSEQQSIADYLDQKCSEIDELISIKQQKIEKLKDYKKSLIFECVTGKRKVS